MYLTIGWLLASLSITLLLVRGAIGYAHRRGMLDQPGQRRSHQLPTPRGGGIGMVVAMLVCLPGVLSGLPAAWPANVIASQRHQYQCGEQAREIGRASCRERVL